MGLGVGELERGRRRAQHGALRDQAHHLALQDGDAAPPGRRFDGGEHSRRGRHIDIEQVHRYLSLPCHLETRGLHRREPAARSANALCNLLGNRHVFRIEVDVERNQERPRTDCRRAGGGVDPLGSEIGIGGPILPDAVP